MKRRSSGPSHRGVAPRGGQRRALTAASRGGATERGGEPALARALAGALAEPARDAEIADSVTHPFHTYPARMHPATARRLVELTLASAPSVSGELRRVLDPFCGGGTTLVEARFAGARAAGIDASPLAVLVTRAKTWTAPRARRSELRAVGFEIAARGLAEGKAARRAGHVSAPLYVPAGVSAARRDAAIAGWFAPHVRREVEFLASEIERLRRRDAEIADLLTAVLSSVLYKVSRRASDTDPSPRPERRVARGAASRLFRHRLELLVAGLGDLATASRAPMPEVRRGDARALAAAGVAARSVSAVITSPPYAGTYDYLDHHGLRMAFFGLDPSPFAAAEIGARRRFQGGGAVAGRAVAAWSQDLSRAVAEIDRVLVPGGLAAIVVGDSRAGDRAVRADEHVRRAAEGRLHVAAWARQTRPLLGAAERRAFGGAPKREHVLLLRKPADHRSRGAVTPPAGSRPPSRRG